MNEGTIRFFRNIGPPGVILQQGHGGRPIMIELACHPRRSSTLSVPPSKILKKAALGTILSLFAAMSMFGCQGSQEQVSVTEVPNVKSANASAPKSNWPKTVTIDAGTILLVSLDAPLRTDINKSGDIFRAHMAEAVRVDQMTVLPQGTEIRGRLLLVEEPHRTAGKAQMTLSFDQVVDPAGRTHSIATAPIVLVAAGDKVTDEAKVVGGAVLGGLIGVLTSSKQQAKGAAVGAAAGAAAGGVVALATKGKQMELPAGHRFVVNLNEPFRVSVTQLTANR